MLFIFFYWLSSKFSKDRKKRKLFKPSLDQELKELIQSDDNSTGIALSVKQYLLDVLDDDKNDREKYSDARLAQGQEILDKAGSSAFYFMADIATQLSIIARCHMGSIFEKLLKRYKKLRFFKYQLVPNLAQPYPPPTHSH
jgi:hypothetical protein